MKLLILFLICLTPMTASAECLTEECVTWMIASGYHIRLPQSTSPPVGCPDGRLATCHPLYDWWCKYNHECEIAEFSLADVYNQNDWIAWHEHWIACFDEQNKLRAGANQLQAEVEQLQAEIAWLRSRCGKKCANTEIGN